MDKTFTTALWAREMRSPFGGWCHHLRPGGKRVTGFSVVYDSLRIQFPCHLRKRCDYKTFTTGLRPRENKPNSLRSLENHTTAPLARGKCIPSAYGTSPRESVSHDSQVAALSYESCLLATPEGEVLAALCLVILMRSLLIGALLSHRSAGGRWCRKAPKGEKPPQAAPSHRLAFITGCLKCGMYQDSSLALRMTSWAGRVSVEQTSTFRWKYRRRRG